MIKEQFPTVERKKPVETSFDQSGFYSPPKYANRANKTEVADKAVNFTQMQQRASNVQAF